MKIVTIRPYLTFFATWLMLTTPTQANDLKIATIDINKVLEKCTLGKKIESELLDFGKNCQSELDSRLKTHQELVEKYKSLETSVNDPSLSTKTQEEHRAKQKALAQEIKSLERDAQEYKLTVSKLINDKRTRQYQALLEKIQETIKNTTGKKYDLILRASSNISISPIIHTNNLPDITQEIITELDKS